MQQEQEHNEEPPQDQADNNTRTHSLGAASSESADLVNSTHRQNGDFSVYKYYFSAVGLKNSLIFLILQVAMTFCETFPSKSLQARQKLLVTYHSCRRLALFLVCFFRNTPRRENWLLPGHIFMCTDFYSSGPHYLSLVCLIHRYHFSAKLTIKRHTLNPMIIQSGNYLHQKLLDAVMT
jgi:hypothetical protein